MMSELIGEIYDYLSTTAGMNDALDSMLRYFNSDVIVKWFVTGYFCGIPDLKRNLGYYGADDLANRVAEHYEKHCR